MSTAILGLLFIGMVILFIEIGERLETKRLNRLNRRVWNPVLLPMIRHYMPKIIANELIGVQPMSGPVGQVFTLRYIFNEPYQMAFPFPYPDPVIKRVPIQLELFMDDAFS